VSFAKAAELLRGEQQLVDFCGCLTNAGATHLSDALA
jgi:hypothetical protein